MSRTKIKNDYQELFEKLEMINCNECLHNIKRPCLCHNNYTNKKLKQTATAYADRLSKIKAAIGTDKQDKLRPTLVPEVMKVGVSLRGFGLSNGKLFSETTEKALLDLLTDQYETHQMNRMKVTNTFFQRLIDQEYDKLYNNAVVALQDTSYDNLTAYMRYFRAAIREQMYRNLNYIVPDVQVFYNICYRQYQVCQNNIYENGELVMPEVLKGFRNRNCKMLCEHPQMLYYYSYDKQGVQTMERKKKKNKISDEALADFFEKFKDDGLLGQKTLQVPVKICANSRRVQFMADGAVSQRLEANLNILLQETCTEGKTYMEHN